MTHVNSLSILSPKPGVSTIVKEIRTPSSSSSVCSNEHLAIREAETRVLTDIVRLDPDALFDVSSFWVIVDLVRDDFGLAKSVNECGATRPGGTFEIFIRGRPNASTEIQDDNLPTTMMVNWTPFLTFFLREAILEVIAESKRSEFPLA